MIAKLMACWALVCCCCIVVLYGVWCMLSLYSRRRGEGFGVVKVSF